jgi:hypothetical protein
MKIEITKSQLEAIKLLADDCSAMCGDSETDVSWKKAIKHIDAMLKKNGLPPRDFAEKDDD